MQLCNRYINHGSGHKVSCTWSSKHVRTCMSNLPLFLHFSCRWYRHKSNLLKKMARVGGNDIPMDGYMDISCNSMQKIILRKFAFFELFAIEFGHVVSHTCWVFFKRMMPEFFYANFTQLHTVTNIWNALTMHSVYFRPRAEKSTCMTSSIC